MKKLEILVVEDDVWMAEQHSRVLKKAGYKPVITNDALSAISYLDEGRPDAMILDVLLPGSTAFALLNELQSYTDTRQLPVVLCTNLAADFALEDVAPYGVKRILDKSMMEPSDVVAAIRSVT